MNKDNFKITIHFPSGKKVKTDTDTIQQLTKDLKNKRKRKRLFGLINSAEIKEKMEKKR